MSSNIYENMIRIKFYNFDNSNDIIKLITNKDSNNNII